MRLTMLRVDATVGDRVHAYARDHDLSLGAAAARLLDIGLRALASTSAGGQARAEALSAEDRSAIARRAALARWRHP